jgi:hypothetical protein
MPRECPGCGATTTPEARFCRRCGVPLKISGGHDTDSPVSPRAQTIPLVDEGRTTDGLWTEESHELATGTSRIKRAEMEDLLRRVSREHADGDGQDGHVLLAKADGSSMDGSATAPAVTSTLKTQSTDAQTIQPSPAAATNTARRKWRLLALPVLGLLLVAGLLSFIYIRRSKVAGAGEPSIAPVSIGAQPAIASESPQPPTEPATQEGLPQTDGAAKPAPSARTRDMEAEAHPEAPATSPAKPSTTPATGQTGPPSTQPVLSASERYQRGQQLWESGNRRAALEEFRAAAAGGVPDAYYYLGSEYYPEGRDPKTLSDGELKAALNYFLRATAGPHSAQASRSAQLLGREYERRKKQSRP